MISIHKALAGLDYLPVFLSARSKISIHKALAGLDRIQCGTKEGITDFNPQGPRGPRLGWEYSIGGNAGISIHKALAGLDLEPSLCAHGLIHFNPQGPRGPRLGFGILIPCRTVDFNPQGPRGPRRAKSLCCSCSIDFNPQGPRGPRLLTGPWWSSRNIFQSTRPSRASTDSGQEIPIYYWISIHKALAGLDTKAGIEKLYTKISIHKALAGLDDGGNKK